jgi:hypothetical protein
VRQHEDRQRAEPRSRAEVAREARAHAGDADRRATAVTHFHGEFKAQRLDLYTDGNRWATADSTRQEQTVAKKGEIPVRSPTGQDLVDSAADNNSSRADRIRSKLYEESEDALDILEKNANIGESIFDRPPTGSYEGTPTPQPHIYETHPAGIDAGTAVTAIFTLGLVIDRAAHRAMEYYEKHVKGDNHAGNR